MAIDPNILKEKEERIRRLKAHVETLYGEVTNAGANERKDLLREIHDAHIAMAALLEEIDGDLLERAMAMQGAAIAGRQADMQDEATNAAKKFLELVRALEQIDLTWEIEQMEQIVEGSP